MSLYRHDWQFRWWSPGTTVLYDPVVILRADQISLGEYCRIDSFVKIEGGLGMTIGKHVHIASFAHVGIGGGYLWVGDEAMIASGARILTGTNTEDAPSMSSAALEERQCKVRLSTVIGAGAFIGAGATVLPGHLIGEGAIIGAGAVVTRDVPAWEVWAGNPARKIRDRRPRS